MTFGAKEAKGHSCEIVRAIVQTRDHKNITMRLLTIPIICESIKGVSTCQYVQQCEHLQALSLADEVKGGEEVEFDILVGLDYYWQFVTGEVKRGNNGPTAVYSSLGWLLSGPIVSRSTSLVTHVLITESGASQEKVKLEEQLRQFWELETLGIEEKESTLYDQFKDKVVLVMKYLFPGRTL